MPVVKMQVQAYADGTDPASAIVITPHFNVLNPAPDYQKLCDDLAVAMDDYYIGTRAIWVKAYDAQGAKPNYPKAEKIINMGQAPASGSIREVALCLSFYAEHNRPRRRGRLYMPVTLCIAGGVGTPRPSQPTIDKIASFVTVLTALGGVDVDWCVYSKLDNQARKVTNWWIDNAWDIQRSRGLEPTARTEGVTGE
jgi:hypothetical protein